MKFENTLEFARNSDERDTLNQFRQKFFIPQHDGHDCVYFTGNSLGLQPKSVSSYVQQELDDWARLGVEGHFDAKNPWLSYHEIFPKQLSTIVGCLPAEVVVMNSLTVNLHLLMVSFYRPTGKRYKIICEAKAFPSDQYALESQVRFHGFDPMTAIVEVRPREGEHALRTDDILSAIEEHGNQVALVMFGGVNYYSGQYFDIPAITAAAHKAGAYAGFDLAHAAGNVQLHLHDWEVDFGCWCSYKYLNSGPGGVAGLYIHQKHLTNKELPRFAGWWGYTKQTRFQMEKGFEAIPTAEGWQLSNAPVLSMAAHKASLDIFSEAGMARLCSKAILLTGYLLFITEEINKINGDRFIEVITPGDEKERGCQLSMLVKQKGKEIFNELSRQGVITDWREPDVIRVAPVPLYNSFEDVWKFGEIVKNTIRRV
jgi:kynureninase